MGIAYFGPNRMAAFQVSNPGFNNQNLTETRPDWGLGPVGMPGSADYLKDAQSRAAAGNGPDKAPNPYEQMGLYWTGNGIAQGRPIRDITMEQGLAPLKVAQGQEALDLSASEQAQRYGLQNRAQNLSSVQALAGVAPTSQSSMASLLGLPTPSSPLVTDNAVIASQRNAIDQQLANTHGLNSVAGISPGPGQAYGAGVLGLPTPPAGGLVDWQQQRAAASQERAENAAAAQADRNTLLAQRELDKQSILPAELAKDPIKLEAVRQGLSVDPNAPDADSQYEAIARAVGIPDQSTFGPRNTRLMSQYMQGLLSTYGPQVQAENARLQRFGAAGAVHAASAGLAPAGVAPTPAGQPSTGSGLAGLGSFTAADMGITPPGAYGALIRPATATPENSRQAPAVSISDTDVDNYIKSHPRYANMPRDTVRAMLQSYFAAQQQ